MNQEIVSLTNYISEFSNKNNENYPTLISVWNQYVKRKELDYIDSLNECKKAFEKLENAEETIKEISNKENLNTDDTVNRLLLLNLLLVNISNNST